MHRIVHVWNDVGRRHSNPALTRYHLKEVAGKPLVNIPMTRKRRYDPQDAYRG